MSFARQFLEMGNQKFPEIFKEKVKHTVGLRNFVVFGRHLTVSNVKYLNGLGYAAILITPEKTRYPRFWKSLKKWGVLMERDVFTRIVNKEYFWIAKPSKFHMEIADMAAKKIQWWWLNLREGGVDSDNIETEEEYSVDFEADGAWGGLEASAPEASAPEASESVDRSDSGGAEVAPLVSRCHAETMRCGECWKNRDDGGERPCWYVNVEKQTSEQREAYQKLISLDTLYLTSSGNGKEERDAAYRNFIQKIGGRTAERISAMQVVEDVMDEVLWDSEDEPDGRAGIGVVVGDSNPDGLRNAEGARYWSETTSLFELDDVTGVFAVGDLVTIGDNEATYKVIQSSDRASYVAATGRNNGTQITIQRGTGRKIFAGTVVRVVRDHFEGDSASRSWINSIFRSAGY